MVITSKWKLKEGIKIKPYMLITPDMVEVDDSEAVQQVAKYVYDHQYTPNLKKWDDLDPDENYYKPRFIEIARDIINIVRDAEDADE